MKTKPSGQLLNSFTNSTMSIVFSYNSLRLIDHEDYINKVYENVANELCVPQSFAFGSYFV